MIVADRWRLEERTATAEDLHASWPSVVDAPEYRAVALCRPVRPAVVLGSTQIATAISPEGARAAGVDIVRRRSGGGAVVVTRNDPVWIDVWIPAGDQLWCDDVTRSFDWLGSIWRSALVDVLGPRVGDGLRVARTVVDQHVRSTWASAICFAGVGLGEVTTSDGRKLVGLAQRRSRHGAWFHGACVVRWDPTVLIDVLVADRVERASAVEELARVAVGVGDLIDASTGPEGHFDRVAGAQPSERPNATDTTPIGSAVEAAVIHRLVTLD